MPTNLEARVAGALTNIRNPRVDNDVISAGMVRDLNVSPEGVVSLTFVLSADDPATLVRETRTALKEVAGVTDVKITVQESRVVHPPRAAQQHQHQAPPTPPNPPTDLAGLGRILAVSSGKGGVGKSTVSANLAVEMARRGSRVGLMD